ncbi:MULTISPECIES: hydrogenase maturation protease [Rhodococcus]|uniref:Hydrogenase maturation protease n=1 Tax=Nocardia globerula TaxID=1818 RepID=A0A652YMA6_NOCGL|nr:MULTISPECIES: hydrogenase maturation protease [Rhodococcus]NMD62171.1 hydrogenase maturation protease [Nocardia globerula]MCE4263554.1 hydrogenase maturation protease [Rhodococcus globerulus]MDV8070871.1 hydrogenase maturation protease [Rhodococcus sp. IEGM 1366]PVX65738.1 hydrogenase maturation protease [Rhodococcus globerulus]ROZ45876.1 hydrogenase maturation protease [Rhodococcus sp. WS3]
MTVTVIGIGNDFRRDDGVGLAVAQAIRHLHPAGARVVATNGEASTLIDTWSGSELAVFVDSYLQTHAVDSSRQPGRIRRFTRWPNEHCGHCTSSHGLGIVEALALGAALDRKPRRVAIYTVEAQDIGFGIGLSPPVAASVSVVVSAIIEEIVNPAKIPSSNRSRTFAVEYGTSPLFHRSFTPGQ